MAHQPAAAKPKVLLTTLTAKYIHSSLSLRYLFEACRMCDVELSLREFHINFPPLSILSAIDAEKPDLVGFSCYIWNISQTLELVDMLRKVRPNCWIVLGGPEVSYDAESLLRENPAVDFVICGEGEEALPMLLNSLPLEKRVTKNSLNEALLARIPGLAYLLKDQVRENPAAVIHDLGGIRSPYAGIGLDNLANKLVYVESSRGCPFSCAYCLSSRTKGVRYFPLDRVKEDIIKLVERGCEQIKFVDRTYNCNKKHAMELWRFLKDLPCNSVFHFEIEAQLLDDEMLEFLESVPPGKFQFEIGVQTTTVRALELIKRKQNWERLADPIIRLARSGNIELHLDLIAGLPGDTFATFSKAFNAVYQLHPTRIQLGFLKVLKGSGLWEKAKGLGLVYQRKPPYEILLTADMSYRELARLKQVESLVDSYYNSHRFELALEFVVNLYNGQAMDFFVDFAVFWDSRGLFQVGHKVSELYRYIQEFVDQCYPKYSAQMRERLVCDFLSVHAKLDLPDWALVSLPIEHRELKFWRKSLYYELLGDESWKQQYVPHLLGLPSRELDKRVRIALLNLADSEYAWYLFDYSQSHPITQRAKVSRIDVGT